MTLYGQYRWERFWQADAWIGLGRDTARSTDDFIFGGKLGYHREDWFVGVGYDASTEVATSGGGSGHRWTLGGAILF